MTVQYPFKNKLTIKWALAHENGEPFVLDEAGIYVLRYRTARGSRCVTDNAALTVKVNSVIWEFYPEQQITSGIYTLELTAVSKDGEKAIFVYPDAFSLIRGLECTGKDPVLFLVSYC